jgi:diguanylate cyclase (GGDEF)-like protein
MTSPDPRVRLGPFLGFPPAIGLLYEAQTGAQRIRMLRAVIPLGLVFYNAYDATNFVIARDVFWWAVWLRLGATVAGLAIVWTLARMTPRTRETILTLAMVGVSAIPLFLFWLSREPLGSYSFSDFFLTVVFGAVLLQLRFPAALLYIALCLAMALAAIWLHRELEPNLRLAFSLQTVSVCSFLLVGNWLMERTQRKSFLEIHARTLQSDALEVARRDFAALSMTDALTGIANRRQLDQALAEAAADLQQGRAAAALLMIDVDHFKRYNDAYGHQAGDACLREVATVLGAAIAGQPGLVFARYGGEEFAVLLRGRRTGEALAMADALQSALAGRMLAHAHRPDDKAVVTASIGVAAFEAGAERSAADLVAAADAALYDAKRLGRDRFVLFDLGGAGE